MPRLVIEDPCIHGTYGQCLKAGWRRVGDTEVLNCPGGFGRRVLTEGEYVLIEKEGDTWPTICIGNDFVVGPLMIATIADALAGGEKP